MNSIFDNDEWAAYRASWAARCARYHVYRAYYTATIYDQKYLYLSTSGSLRALGLAQELYQGIRTLFSPLRRCVRIDVAKVPGGWALPEQVRASTVVRVRDMRQSLAAQAQYEKFVMFGAVAGEAAMLLSGSPEAPVLQALRPDEAITGTRKDGQPFGIVVKQVNEAGTSYEYAQIITPVMVATYKDGQFHDYDGGGSVRRNAWGFVPLVFSAYIEGEDGLGQPAFGGVLQLLDRVNELASLTLDVLARNAEPLMVATGVDEVTRAAGDDLLKVPNPDAKFYTVDPKLAIGETLAVIQDVRAEYKANLPQLTIDQLYGAKELAYDTVITLLQELGDHIIAVRGNVDRAVATIERWALGGAGGVPEDYELWRERAWMALTPGQLLALEASRLDIELKRRSIEL